MASKIAKGVASTGPDDKLVAVDANATTTDMVLSRVKTAATTAGSGVADAAKKAALDPKTVVGAIKIENGSIGLNSKSIKSILTKGLTGGARIDKAAGPDLTGIPGIGKDTAAVANKYLKGIVGDSAAEMIGTAGEAYKIGKDVDTDTAAGLMKGIGKLTKLDQFTELADKNAELAIGLSYLDKAIALGIPDAIDALMKKFKAERRARERLLGNIRGVLMRGDLATIKIIFGYIGAQAVIDQVPEACTYILAGYSMPYRTSPKNYQSLRGELLGVLNELDPNWDKEKRGSTYISKLEPFAKLSSASKTLLQLDGQWDIPITLAHTIRKVDLYGLMKKNYPLMVKL